MLSVWLLVGFIFGAIMICAGAFVILSTVSSGQGINNITLIILLCSLTSCGVGLALINHLILFSKKEG